MHKPVKVKVWLCFAVVVWLAVRIVLAGGYAYAFELPDSVKEWRCVNEYVVPLILDVNSEDLGRIVYRDYEREMLKGTVQVILTEGRGTGSLYVPEEVRDVAGAMPAESGYRIIDIDGRKSIIERHEFIPISIAVDAGENIVITIESSTLNEEEITEFARNILQESKIH